MQQPSKVRPFPTRIEGMVVVNKCYRLKKFWCVRVIGFFANDRNKAEARAQRGLASSLFYFPRDELITPPIKKETSQREFFKPSFKLSRENWITCPLTNRNGHLPPPPRGARGGICVRPFSRYPQSWLRTYHLNPFFMHVWSASVTSSAIIGFLGAA